MFKLCNSEHIKIIKEIKSKHGDDVVLVGKFLGLSKTHTFKCQRGHTWPSRIRPILNGYNCPKCNRMPRKTDGFLTQEAVPNRLFQIHGNKLKLEHKFKGLKEIHRFSCDKGHVWEAKVLHHLQGYGCRQCSNISATLNKIKSEKHILYRIEALFDGRIKLNEPYKNNTQIKHEFICDKGHTWQTSISGISNRTIGCKICLHVSQSKERTWSHEKYCEVLYSRHENRVTLTEEYKGTQQVHEFICDKGHLWKTRAGSVIKQNNGKQNGCPKCCRAPSSSKESDQWLDNYEKLVGRKILREYRIDLGWQRKIRVDGFDPVANRVLEFYGDFYHGNINRFPLDYKVFHSTVEKEYARTKSRNRQLINKNYEVIYIWEDEYRKGLPFHHIRPHPFLRIPLIVRHPNKGKEQ